MLTKRDSTASESAAKDDEERREVERAIGRDREAFGALYTRHVSRVFRHLYYMVGQEAEDLTAETFLRAWKAIDRYEIRKVPFIYWLLRIAHNQGVSYLRSRRETRQLTDLLPDNSSANDPEAAAEQQLALANVRKAISLLRDPQRKVLTMYLMEDRDYRTVAALMGKNVQAVRVLKHRGLRNLRELVQEAV